MSFNDQARLDTSQVESGGRGGGGGGFPGGLLPVGGGVGGIVLLVVIFVLKAALGGGSTGTLPALGDGTSGSTGSGTEFSQCRTGADANQDATCRIIGTVNNSVQAYWAGALPAYGKTYTKAPTVIYSGSTPSACGTASNAVGPFYCPLDKKVYIDASFFAELTSRFGADNGALAQEYVVAHEYGHHIQDILGILGRAQSSPQGATSGSVRIELMADCLAGVWANHAASTEDADGQTFLKPLTKQDIDSALSAASAVGDDRIQEKTQGQVNEETWTHGSSAERQRWFSKGYATGDLNACNTLTASSL